MAEHHVRDGPPLGLSYHMPDDPILLAIGRVAIVHGQLHDAVTMTIKTLADVTPAEARNANDGARFAELTARVRRLAFEKLGDGQALIKLDSILQRARAANKRRNDLLHSLWAAPPDGSPVTRDEGEWAPAPEVAELRDLESKMSRLVYEIHEGRLNGWLFEALKAAKEKALKK